MGRSDGYDYAPNKFNCPCATYHVTNSPVFVGNDYCCDSGVAGDSDENFYYLSNPLWDGNGCTLEVDVVLQLGCHGSIGNLLYR